MLRRALVFLAFSVIVSSSVLGLSATRAAAEPLGWIRNNYTLLAASRCVGADQSSQNDGVWLNQFDCNPAGPALSQQWTVQKTFSGANANLDYYRIINNNSGRCMDVIGASVADGTHVTQYQCLGGSQTNQLWRIVFLTPGWYQIISVNSGKCLGMDASFQGTTGASAAAPGNSYGLNQWGCIDVNSGPLQGPGNKHRTQVWNIQIDRNGTAGDCAVTYLVERLSLQAGDVAANGMRSNVRKTAYALPTCFPDTSSGEYFIAQPGAHMGLGATGSGGIIETGYYRTRLNGAQIDQVFAEIESNGNAFYKDAVPLLKGPLCGSVPFDNQYNSFEISVASGNSWNAYTNCSASPTQNFPNAGFSQGLPTLEFEASKANGIRAGGALLAEQTSIEYRRSGTATTWLSPTGKQCWRSQSTSGFVEV